MNAPSLITRPRVAALLISIAITANANNLITDPGPGPVTTATGSMTLGYSFSTGSNVIEVTGLGIWDQGQDGLANPHTVGLWDVGGSDLVASVVIPSGTSATLSGQFRFVSLSTPIFISGNFVLGASYAASDADAYIANRDPQQATTDPNIAFIGFAASSSSGTGFTYPNNVDGNGSNVGPNLQFNVVPEPSTIALLIGAGSAVGIVRRSRRKS